MRVAGSRFQGHCFGRTRGLGCLIRFLCKGLYFLHLMKGGLSGCHKHSPSSFPKYSTACCNVSLPGTSNRK